MLGRLLGGGTYLEAMRTTAGEDEETGLLGNVVNKRYGEEICILLKTLIALGVVGLVVKICICWVF